jgi:Na+/H+ antiporter NhaD/arsenite permease-like protein
LTAGAASNIAVALLLAAVLQPVLAIVQQQRAFRVVEARASLILFTLGTIMFVLAN